MPQLQDRNNYTIILQQNIYRQIPTRFHIYLHTIFPGKWIAHEGPRPVTWLSLSRAFGTKFSLWGFVKDMTYILAMCADLRHITVTVKAKWTEISCGDMRRIRLSVQHLQANKRSSYKIGLHKLGAYFTSGVMSSWLSVF